MLYIHGGNEDQVRLSQQLFHFCNESLFSKKEKPQCCVQPGDLSPTLEKRGRGRGKGRKI